MSDPDEFSGRWDPPPAKHLYAVTVTGKVQCQVMVMATGKVDAWAKAESEIEQDPPTAPPGFTWGGWGVLHEDHDCVRVLVETAEEKTAGEAA